MTAPQHNSELVKAGLEQLEFKYTKPVEKVYSFPVSIKNTEVKADIFCFDGLVVMVAEMPLIYEGAAREKALKLCNEMNNKNPCVCIFINDEGAVVVRLGISTHGTSFTPELFAANFDWLMMESQEAFSQFAAITANSVDA